MAVRWMVLVALLVLAAPGVAPAQQFPGVYGRKLLISDPGGETERKIVVKIVNANLDVAGIAPLTNGVFLHVYNSAGTSDSVCYSLPASGWKAAGSGFRYTDPTAANGPCHVAILRRAKLFKAVCKATKSPIDYTLDESAQASVAVRFGGGSIAYCADFGGADRGDVPGKKFLGKNAFPPLQCPTPPASCPPAP
jgi:hypothetical protein